MLDLNWTREGRAGGNRRGRNGMSSPRHYRLFGITTFAFLIIYAVICVPIALFYAGFLPTHWPGLLIPATPFVAVLGIWKFIAWFGVRFTALTAGLAGVAATFSHPLWAPVLLGWNPARTVDDWVTICIVAWGLTAWLIAESALLIGPVRLIRRWRLARRQRT